MAILFALIVMRMSGAIAFNPIFGRTNVPGLVKGALILTLSSMLYTGVGGTLVQEPGSMLEFGAMLVMELLFGFVLGFSMELSLLVIRFASSIMDFVMGLSMAQIYDPEFNTQTTVTSGLYYAYFSMIFLVTDCHVRLIRLFFVSAETVPFGGVQISLQLAPVILEIFTQAIAMGLQFAFPLIAMELVTEFAIGILMRIIPQINVFVVNFQLKLIIGMSMLLVLFSPMTDKMYVSMEDMFQWLDQLMALFEQTALVP